MGEKQIELNKIRSERAKSLFGFWKATHPNERKTQTALAAHMGISPIVLNAKINGHRTITENDCRKIAKFFPGVRVEYLLGYDDFRTAAERSAAILDKAESDATALDVLIRRIANDAACSIKLLENASLPEGLQLDTDCYAIVENGTVVGLVPVSEYIALRHEIADFASFVVNKKISSCKKQLIAPFPYKEDISHG